MAENPPRPKYTRTNYRQYQATAALRDALPIAGYPIVTSSTVAPSVATVSGSQWIVRDSEGEKPLLHWASPGPIPMGSLVLYGQQVNASRYEAGIVVTVNPQSPDILDKSREHNLEILTYDQIISRISEREREAKEAREELERSKNYLEMKGSYEDSKLFSENLSLVSSAKTPDEKKKALEELTVLLAQKLLLTDIKVDKRTPSSEIDVEARNDRVFGIWGQFGTPILFECKNWESSVSSNEIRNFVLKGTPAKTRFFVAWNGITGEDELKGAKLEIIKAKERGIFVMVLTKMDFVRIAGGVGPESVIAEKYYELINDRVLVD